MKKQIKKRKTWKSKLNKKELKHLKEMGITNKASWLRNLEHQKRLRDSGGVEPCWDCRFIAEKLGMEDLI